MHKYIIDSNVVIHIEERYHFIEGLLDFMNDLYSRDKLVLLKKIKEELKEPTEDTKGLWRYEFLKNKDFINLDTDSSIVDSTSSVMSKLDKSVANDASQISEWTNSLDPWLIIYAHHFKFNMGNGETYILTHEKINMKNPKKLKIPYIAEKCDVHCCDFEKFLQKEGKKVVLV